MIRFLAISFLCSFLLISCSLKTTEGLRQVNVNKTDVENPYFSNTEIDYVYKAKIDVYNKNFGGILIIKKIGFDSHRVVFTTEFGSKILDFQFDGDNFKKKFVVKDLDRKIFISILRDDFKLLISESIPVMAAYESESQKIYKTKKDKRFNFYMLNKGSGKLEKIVSTSKTKEKVEINFISTEAQPAGGQENIADSISIKHNNIKLTIDLEKFKKE